MQFPPAFLDLYQIPCNIYHKRIWFSKHVLLISNSYRLLYRVLKNILWACPSVDIVGSLALKLTLHFPHLPLGSCNCSDWLVVLFISPLAPYIRIWITCNFSEHFPLKESTFDTHHGPSLLTIPIPCSHMGSYHHIGWSQPLRLARHLP